MLAEHLREDRRSVAPNGQASRNTWVQMCEAALQELWDKALESLSHEGEIKGVALAAVGSLGRNECGPESDIDLILLHDGAPHAEISGGVPALADALWYPLWDSHIDLDHSVRSLAQCRDVASNDLSASIALLDIRCIAGDAELVERASAIIHSDWRKGARLRFSQIEEERAVRIRRAGELAYEIEGDIKQAAGGLRDAMMIRALVASWLAERPAIDYTQAHSFLLDVRDALASITRRHGHVLAIRLHAEVAHLLGIEGEHPEDELLARVSKAACTIRGAYEDTAARARRNVTPARTRFRFVRGKRRPVFDVVAPNIVNATGELALTKDAVVDRALIWNLARASIDTGLPIRQATLMNLKDEGAWSKTKNGLENWSENDRQQFEAILASGQAQIPLWEQFDLTGIITDIIPRWQNVRNVPQRSVIHRHTVDRHQIEAISLLPETTTLEGKGIADLSSGYRSALLLATFLHDIGKRPGMPGHSERGALIAAEVAAYMGYGAQIVKDTEKLVRHHLLLGQKATSADPADPHTGKAIREAIGEAELLDCLHLLTQADARSCKAEAWDEWKASLVAELVLSAKKAEF